MRANFGIFKYFLPLTLILIAVSLPQFSDAVVDDTKCVVKSESDDVGQFHSLRRKIEHGFNRSQSRACVEMIEVDNSSVKNIQLKSPLIISNDKDLDCDANHPLCDDGWAFILDGGNARMILDVSQIAASNCAVQLKANDVLFRKINIQASAEQIQNKMVLCDEGNDNDLSDVRINGSTDPEATPSPTPSATPTPTNPPLAPAELTGEVEGDASSFKVKLTWTDQSDDEEGFRIERGILNDSEVCESFISLNTVAMNTVQYDDESANPNFKYCYRVYTFIGTVDSNSPSNTIIIETPGESLPIPVDLVASPFSDEQINLSWTYDETAVITGFHVERGNEACDEDSFDQVAQIANAEARSYEDMSLIPETTYCYRVRAYQIVPVLLSQYSPTDTATTLELGATPSPMPTPTASPMPTPTATPSPTDTDGDGVDNDVDNCPDVPNGDQKDLDGDNTGDLCDDDIDGDGIPNDQEPGQGTDPLDNDTDDDGHLDGNDNCPQVANPGQQDADNDSIGDPCDSNDPDDTDGDGIANNQDNCPNVANTDQNDADEDGLGDACDLSGNAVLSTGGCQLGPITSGSSVWLMLAASLIGMVFLRKRFGS